MNRSSGEVRLNETSPGVVLNGSETNGVTLSGFHNNRHNHYYQSGKMRGSIVATKNNNSVHYERTVAKKREKYATAILDILIVLFLLLIGISVIVERSNVREEDGSYVMSFDSETYNNLAYYGDGTWYDQDNDLTVIIDYDDGFQYGADCSIYDGDLYYGYFNDEEETITVVKEDSSTDLDEMRELYSELEKIGNYMN